jgi:hypothetical protein
MPTRTHCIVFGLRAVRQAGRRETTGASSASVTQRAAPACRSMCARERCLTVWMTDRQTDKQTPQSLRSEQPTTLNLRAARVTKTPPPLHPKKNQEGQETTKRGTFQDRGKIKYFNFLKTRIVHNMQTVEKFDAIHRMDLEFQLVIKSQKCSLIKAKSTRELLHRMSCKANRLRRCWRSRAGGGGGGASPPL